MGGVGLAARLGQEYLYGGAPARLADHGDVAPVLPDYAVDHGQAQAGALVHLLGGEEGLEDLLAGLLVHALAGVAHRQHGIGRRLHIGVHQIGRLVQVRVGGLDAQAAALGHGVAGVGHQVKQHLLHLVLVRVHRAQGRFQGYAQLHVLADHPPDQALVGLHHLVEGERLKLAHLAAAEGQELAYQVSGLEGAFEHAFQVGPVGAALVQVFHGQLGVADDHREDIVEVVGDAPGQVADGLHLLGLAQLLGHEFFFFFGPALLAYVPVHHDGSPAPRPRRPAPERCS